MYREEIKEYFFKNVFSGENTTKTIILLDKVPYPINTPRNKFEVRIKVLGTNLYFMEKQSRFLEVPYIETTGYINDFSFDYINYVFLKIKEGRFTYE